MTERKQDKPLVTFWGTRGSIPTPGSTTEKYGGNTSCVTVHYDGTDIILDAGTGVRGLGIQLVSDMEDKPPEERQMDLNLLLSHTHWDHIQGLPFFHPAYLEGTRLTIYGSPKKEQFLQSILEGQMDVDYFPVDMNAFQAEIAIKEVKSNNIQIGSVQVRLQEQIRHPGGSVRYRLKCGKKSVVYATDVELNTVFDADSPSADDKRLAEQYRKFIRNADLLIADGQYTNDQYLPKKHLRWGHTSIPLLVKIAYEEKVKQLAVFHHDPQNSDSLLDALWGKYAPEYGAMDPPMNVFWAREGMTLAV